MEAFHIACREGLQTTVSLEKVMATVIWDIHWIVLVDFTLHVVQWWQFYIRWWYSSFGSIFTTGTWRADPRRAVTARLHTADTTTALLDIWHCERSPPPGSPSRPYQTFTRLAYQKNIPEVDNSCLMTLKDEAQKWLKEQDVSFCQGLKNVRCYDRCLKNCDDHGE